MGGGTIFLPCEDWSDLNKVSVQQPGRVMDCFPPGFCVDAAASGMRGTFWRQRKVVLYQNPSQDAAASGVGHLVWSATFEEGKTQPLSRGEDSATSA